MEDLSLEDSSISEERTSVIYTSLMSMMRLIFKQDEAAMEIDKEIAGGHEIDKGDKEQSQEEDNDSEQCIKENDEKVKLKKFAVHLISNTSKTNSKKSATSYRSYIASQIVDFVGLIVDQVQVKDAAAKTSITLSTAYRYQKMWNETQEVLEKKKRG